MPQPKTLRVFPNPYHLDHEGRPSGAYPYEPDLVNGDTQLRYVGATRKSTPIGAPRPILGISKELEQPHDHTWEYSREPTTVPSTDYYHRGIRTGDLIAADLESWKLAGCDPKKFVEPEVALAKAKHAAIANHVAHYGEEPAACVHHWSAKHLADLKKADEEKAAADAAAKRDREAAQDEKQAAHEALAKRIDADAAALAAHMPSAKTPNPTKGDADAEAHHGKEA